MEAYIYHINPEKLNKINQPRKIEKHYGKIEKIHVINKSILKKVGHPREQSPKKVDIRIADVYN